MFSYSLRVRKLANPIGNLQGFCDLVVDDALVIKDFKILQSKTGELFAAAPSQASNKVDDQGQKQWFPTIYFIDAKESEDSKRTPVESEILAAMVKEFVSTSPSAAAPKTETSSRPAAKSTSARKPNPWSQ